MNTSIKKNNWSFEVYDEELNEKLEKCSKGGNIKSYEETVQNFVVMHINWNKRIVEEILLRMKVRKKLKE